MNENLTIKYYQMLKPHYYLRLKQFNLNFLSDKDE